MYLQPLPKISPLTKPFWDACRERRLSIQRCGACGHYRFYPCAACPYCASAETTWETLSGAGSIYSWIVIHRSVDPEWQALAPFVTVIIEIAEQPGVLIPGLLTGLAPEAVRAGLPVEIAFEDATPDITLFRWRPRT